MKKLILILTLSIGTSLAAQRLETVYKNGEVKLTPDPAYAKNTDWEKVFIDYNQFSGGKNTGVMKQIVVAPDGSVYMSHRSRHSISKFDKNGNFVKEFGKKGGKKASDFIYTPTVQGILDGKFLYTTAVDGRMHFFDLNGQWVKTISLKYMPLGTYPLKEGKIAIVGFSAGKQNNTSIRILNFYNGTEKVISSETQAKAESKSIVIMPNAKGYTDSDGKYHVSSTFKPPVISHSLPFSHDMYYRVRLAATVDGNLIAAYPSTGQIVIYSPSGQKVKQFKADIKPDAITREDREEYYQKAANDLKKLEADVLKSDKDKEYWSEYIAQYKAQLYKFRDPANYPEHLPYFSEMMIDSENNILLFRFTREEGSNKFEVYTFDNHGSRIATSSFISDDYELKVNPSVFKFYKHNIYSFVKLKNGSNNSFRLVKFKILNF